MRNFSVAGGLSGAMTLPPQRPPRQAAGRKTGTRMQASRGSSMLQNPVADVSTKLEQEAAAARTDKYVDPGEWEPSLGKPYKPPFRSVYSAFGSSTASPRHGADESAWFWFGGNRSAPPSATATALAEKDMFSVPNATAERDDAGSAGPGSEGGRPKTASLRGWKRNQSYAQEYTRSEYRLRKLPPKGRADLARYTRAASAQGSSRRSRFGSSGGLQRRGWPQAAFRPTRETMLNVPTHGVPLAHKPDERAFVPSPQHYDVERAWRSKRLQRARSTPAYTVRRRLKSKREMLVATGHSEPPAPGTLWCVACVSTAEVDLTTRALAPRRTSQGAFFRARWPQTRQGGSVWPQAGLPPHHRQATRHPRGPCARWRGAAPFVCCREPSTIQGRCVDNTRAECCRPQVGCAARGVGTCARLGVCDATFCPTGTTNAWQSLTSGATSKVLERRINWGARERTCSKTRHTPHQGMRKVHACCVLPCCPASCSPPPPCKQIQKPHRPGWVRQFRLWKRTKGKEREHRLVPAESRCSTLRTRHRRQVATSRCLPLHGRQKNSDEAW